MLAQRVEEIQNYLEIPGTAGTGGQPMPPQFAAIKAAGYQMVVNLAMPDSSNALPDESELVAAQGLEYVHIPVVWEAPTVEDLETFFQVMDQNAGRRVFVHCALNWRVSCFLLLYRVIRQGVALNVAKAALQQVWKPNPVWERFVLDALSRHGVAVDPQEVW